MTGMGEGGGSIDLRHLCERLQLGRWRRRLLLLWFNCCLLAMRADEHDRLLLDYLDIVSVTATVGLWWLIVSIPAKPCVKMGIS